MNCLYIRLFFNIVAGIVQTFIKSFENASVSPKHRSLPSALWTTSWLLLAPQRTSVLPLENSWHKFVTFCRFITLPQTATICLWISAGRSPFALRNLMAERTSHLAGLWIRATISNTSHSNKAGFTTVKWARLIDKGSRSMAVLPL